jgi:hypothetical protein
LNAFRRWSTSAGIRWLEIQRSLQILPEYGTLRSVGIIQRRPENFPSEILPLHSAGFLSSVTENATFAERIIKPNLPIIETAFVPPDAKRLKKEKMAAILRKESASCVDRRSKLTRAEKPKLVRASVVGCFAAGQSEVFNLAVEGCPEFFANGVLVHNCARNGIVGAYNSLLSCATPVKMGAYESPSELAGQPEFLDVEEIIRESEEKDFELNRER